MSGAGGGRVRPATEADVAAVDAMVRELAAFEREPDAVQASPQDLRAALFGPDPRVHAHVAEVDGPDGAPTVVGMAVWYVTYSTWTGRHGIWLEDLYVRPAARGAGLGRALLAALAAECLERGHRRLEWWVLDWNAPAQAVYRAIGARPEDAWTVWRLDGRELEDLGRSRPGARDGAR
ncbi:GNAT family N-acetyltransferase [Quadrisphaera sp. DSM 44207]|uniref:GNAT family N-acetyltransferase n=1 Tax=Quadrisphaera sp. DSM 44207 TaxID=1881057 RepID=UPI0008809989|nr:GNAT family N-acetyltransferase [Quadrisphaera sp. DSM 44207]SDQ08576.1 L-amino acid N-acyltransferase YncA [Quadrisphaera sp. DSM 44207]